MTTREAAARYLHGHRAEWHGQPLAMCNPHGVDVATLPVIYGLNNGGGGDWWNGLLMAEDGTCLGGHMCSHEGYMPHDLGCLEGSRPDRHETFLKHYPDGYRMEFVSLDDVRSHPGVMLAYERNQEQAKADKELGASA